MKRLLILSVLLILVAAPAFGAAPAINFSNMTDAPITGWEGSSTKGAAVSIYCNNVGTSRGSSYVTIGGVNLTNASDYAEWGATTNPRTPAGLQRITFWLNSSMAVGDTTISVTTTDGTSQTIPFHTRVLGSNHIYFVSLSGDDAHDGLTTTTPKRHTQWLRANLVAGDTAYLMAGNYTSANSHDDDTATYNYAEGGIFTFCDYDTENNEENHNDGSVGLSINIAAYPAADVQVDTTDDNGAVDFIKTKWSDISGWGFSNFTINALLAVNFDDDSQVPFYGHADHFRFIGNSITSPSGVTAEYGDGMHLNGGNGTTYIYILGNVFHDLGADSYHGAPTQTQYRSYSIYVTGYGTWDYLYVGHNEVDYIAWGRGMQFYGHLSTDKLDHCYIYNNYIHDTPLHCCVVSGGDGFGTHYQFNANIWVYNNKFIGSSNSTGDTFQINGPSDGGTGGTYYVYNNIFWQGNDKPALAIEDSVDYLYFQNNIIHNEPNGHNYNDYYPGGEAIPADHVTSDHNIWYGCGASAKPSWDYSTLDNTDPLFVSSTDYHLQPTSPARDAGTSTAPTVVADFDGISRPQGAAYDIGAYEYVSTTGPDRSAGSPAGEQPSGTTSITMSLTTDVAATCKYGADGATGVAYASLANTFATTGGTSHSVTISGLSDGNSYSRAVRCERTSDNEVNDSDYIISWSITNTSSQHTGSTHIGTGFTTIGMGSFSN